MTDNIVVERRDGVVRLTLNRPARKNTMLPPMCAELTDILSDIEDRSDDRVVVLRGAGRSFCSGADVAARWSAGSDPTSVMSPREALDDVKQCVLGLANLSKPTVAAVVGIATGAGCNLAILCDLVVASERARFSDIFVRRGLTVHTGGSWIVPQLVGSANARRLALLGEIITAPTAFKLGLITHVLSAEDFESRVHAIAGQLAQAPPDLLATGKHLLAEAATQTLAEASDSETRAQLDMLARPHVAAAMREFLSREVQATTVPSVANISQEGQTNR